MYIYVYIHTHTYIHIYIHIYIYMYVCIHVFFAGSSNNYVCVCACVCIDMYVSGCLDGYIYKEKLRAGKGDAIWIFSLHPCVAFVKGGGEEKKKRGGPPPSKACPSRPSQRQNPPFTPLTSSPRPPGLPVPRLRVPRPRPPPGRRRQAGIPAGCHGRGDDL